MYIYIIYVERVSKTLTHTHTETREVLNSWLKNQIYIHCVIKCARIEWCGTKKEHTHTYIQKMKKRVRSIKVTRSLWLSRGFLSSFFFFFFFRLRKTHIIYTRLKLKRKWTSKVNHNNSNNTNKNTSARDRERNGQNSHLAWCTKYLYTHINIYKRAYQRECKEK